MNIYDIAKLAGVSIATVSRVMNDSPRVSEKTKEKVRRVMEENNYTPNVFARGLGLDSMKTIGIICPDVSDIYMARAVSFLEHRLRSYDYDCILYCSGHEQKKKEQSLERIMKKRIDALVMVGSTYAGYGNANDSTDYIINSAKTIPVFIVNGIVQGENIYSVYSMDEEATYEATSKLIESGRKRILFLTDSSSYSASQKMAGYERALRDHSMPILGDLKLYAKNQVQYVRDILLVRKALNFDSVLATDDGLAVGAVKYAHAKGLNIPEDLCIVGYNDSEYAICCEPELTSIDNTPEKLCNITIDTMMNLLQGKAVKTEIPVECSLVKRCTTDF
ncbi:MAG: LacI family transcriptional regulator [Clostridiales bacterium]|nr:LacI family transcriptional regulator [Clostridiales bacterium]